MKKVKATEAVEEKVEEVVEKKTKSHPTVADIQKRLLAWGIIGDTFEFGDEMTEATVQAIKNFQSSMGLPITGEVDAHTTKELFK